MPSTGKRNGELGAAVYWDLAATEKTDFNAPDWTVGIKLGRDRNGCGSWNEELFRVLEGFPDLAHDDEVDACSGALEMFSLNMKDWGYIEWLRDEAEKKKEQEKPPPPKTNYAVGSVKRAREHGVALEDLDDF